eukprot:scpid65816/ scgid7343/ 
MASAASMPKHCARFLPSLWQLPVRRTCYATVCSPAASAFCLSCSLGCIPGVMAHGTMRLSTPRAWYVLHPIHEPPPCFETSSYVSGACVVLATFTRVSLLLQFLLLPCFTDGRSWHWLAGYMLPVLGCSVSCREHNHYSLTFLDIIFTLKLDPSLQQGRIEA